MRFYRHSTSGLLAMALMLASGAQAQKISFRQAVELSLKRGAAMGMAMADQARARQGYLEARNAYVPQVTFGSGAAKTWGYPMSIEGSAPSVFNVNSQSFLYNSAQREFLRAARTDWNAASLSVEDQRAATILETALTYIQLGQAEDKLAALQQGTKLADRVITVSQERFQEGVDSKLDIVRANLNAARVRMRAAEAQGNADLLRQRLAQLTGLDVRELDVDPATIPARPAINQHDDLAERAAANSPAVKAADEKAQATALRAKGEHRQLYPAIDLVGNYGLFTKYNNLDLLFPSGRFSRNNATFGVEIRLPFLNAAQRSRASAVDADALKARKQAQAAREQVSNETLKLQRAVEQWVAARDVAQLDYELAQAGVDAAEAKIQVGNATIKDSENARLDAGDKYAALLDAQFELERVRLQLLRLTGELEKWALP